MYEQNYILNNENMQHFMFLQSHNTNLEHDMYTILTYYIEKK